MNPPLLFGKMNASGDESEDCCFQGRRSSANSFGMWTTPKLLRVLPHGRILPLYAVSWSSQEWTCENIRTISFHGERPNPSDATYPFIPQFLRGNNWAYPILPALPTQVSEPFPFVDEIFNPACPVTKSPVTHTDNGKEWGFSGRMIPNPVLRHIQPLGDILGCEERILHRSRSVRSLSSLRLSVETH